jgi:hypothetical protein
MMTSCRQALSSTVVAVWLLGGPTLAQAQLNESPITPGFWSFPGRKAVTAQEIRAACRNHFEIRFGDGHFIGLTMHKTETNFTQRLVEDVGRCMFDRKTQIDHCEKKVIHPDGSIMVGTTENRYSFDSDRAVKVIVTPKMITDTPFSDAPFDAFPVRCPDATMWSILNESGSPR